jgi:hypothetical protein
MVRWLVGAAVLLWLAAGPAGAQTVTVRSGEHAGFTRLVLGLPAATGWRLNRTDDGYALAFSRALRFDLGQVFRLIPRDRLAAIWADPASGDLRLGLGCRCHAAASEDGPGVLVIDLRDGPPPPGSPFELTAAGAPAGAIVPRDALRPRRRPAALTADAAGPAATEVYDWRRAAAAAGYDWRRVASAPAEGGAPPAAPLLALPDAGGAAAGDVLGSLYGALGRGAARGVVELTLPRGRLDPAGPAAGALPHLRLGAADLPPAEAGGRGDLTAAGRACVPDGALDLAGWGDARPVAVALGPRTAELFGEFDRPDAEAGLAAARYLLHLGFGAEAARVLAATAPENAAAPVLQAIARIVDGAPVRDGPLAGMEGCETAAALWAVLAAPAMPEGRVAIGAVVRAFAGLPPHLRRHLGPPLAERLMDAGQTAAARAVQAAILRAPGAAGPAAELTGLRLAGAAGEEPDPAAVARLAASPGPTAVGATILALDTAAAARRAPDPALLTAAEALLLENRGTEGAAELAAALAAGQALAADFGRAFALAAADPGAAAQVWTILADAGADAHLLAHAVRGPADMPAPLPPAAERALAARLIDLGFAEEALAWLAPARRGPAGLAAEDRMLAARAHLAAGNARATLRHLAGAEGAEAATLREAAALRLALPVDPALPPGGGADPAGVAAGDAALRARRTGQWDIVAAVGGTPWAEAAAQVQPDAPGPAGSGPLTRARMLQEDAGVTRAALAALIAATGVPPAAEPAAR